MKIEEITKSNKSLDLSKQILLNVIVTNNILQENFNEILKPYDISGEQFNVLRILRGKNGATANMCDIQERMISKNSNTTRLIDKLLVKKYVDRQVCPENRRKIEVMITQKGLDLLTDLDPQVIAHEQRFFSNLSTEEATELVNLLEKYRTLI